MQKVFARAGKFLPVPGLQEMPGIRHSFCPRLINGAVAVRKPVGEEKQTGAYPYSILRIIYVMQNIEVVDQAWRILSSTLSLNKIYPI